MADRTAYELAEWKIERHVGPGLPSSLSALIGMPRAQRSLPSCRSRWAGLHSCDR
jgi:hypothetical protein